MAPLPPPLGYAYDCIKGRIHSSVKGSPTEKQKMHWISTFIGREVKLCVGHVRAQRSTTALSKGCILPL